MLIQITEGTIAEAAHILAQIPEFAAAPYALEKYQERLYLKSHLILMAMEDNKIVGCKLGYALNSACFYSWMGGVLPQWRRHGIAEKLAMQQEAWLRNQGYTHVRFKTRNSCRAMLLFALRRGFNIIGVEPKEAPAENRIWLEKEIISSE